MSKFKIGDSVFFPKKNDYNTIIIQFQVTQIEHHLILINGELRISNCYLYTRVGPANNESYSAWVVESSLFGSFEEAVKYFGGDVFKSFERLIGLESLV